jgi:prevent-host-death family protein
VTTVCAKSLVILHVVAFRRKTSERPTGGQRPRIRRGGEGSCSPSSGELDADLLAAISGGQAVVLTREGVPAAVVIDVDSYEEWSAATGLSP